MGTLMTPAVLRLIKGVAQAVGDEHSAESGYTEIINLLGTEGSDGFFLDPEADWQPAFAQLKNGGVFSDSDAVTGRELVAGAYDDVQETMTVLVKASDWLAHGRLMRRLFKLRDDAIAFHTTGYQIDPVFIEYQHPQSKCKQYAVIKTMDIAQTKIDYPDYNQMAVTRVTIGLLRDPKWRMVVPPGGNPILYHFWKQGKSPGADFDYSDMSLFDGTDHFHYEIINNRWEWDATTYDTYLAKNYIDLDAIDIPGDAPPDLYIDIGYDLRLNISNMYPKQVFIGRSTLPRTLKDQDGDTFYGYNTLNAGDADAASLITKTVDTCGVYSNGSVANQYVGAYTVPAGVSTSWREDVVRWWNPAVAGRTLNLTSFRGSWMAFIRARQSNGAVGDIKVRLVVTERPTTSVTLEETVLPVLTPLAFDCAVQHDLIYMGRFDLPSTGNTNSFIDGRGLSVVDKSTGRGNLRIQLQTWNQTAATRDIEIVDLILIPIEDNVTNILSGLSDYVAPTGHMIYDSSGYLSHGIAEPTAKLFNEATNPEYRELASAELRGDVSLVPGQDNRLYFLFHEEINSVAYSRPSDLSNMTIRLNIVPCCYGIADAEPNP